jgi:endonuclease/exonuclease/phosphatase family metal-dependent hydrolase
MTFNVNGAGQDDGVNAWPNRAALNVATIKRYRPDLIGFQEIQAANLATYIAELDGYEHVRGHNYGDVEPTEWTSIFWKEACFALIASGQFWLSRTPDVPSVDWNVEYPMGATWVRLRCRESGAELLHLNTHLDDESELSRVEGSKLIARRVAELQADQLPAVVTGDFNCNPWHAPYEVFLNSGFTDTYRAAGHGDSVASSTFHGRRGEAYFALEWGGEIFWRVDWILVRDGAQRLQTTSCTIIRDAEPPLYPSDHYPVVSEMLLRA